MNEIKSYKKEKWETTALRPREKMRLRGIENLSDRELMALILGTGGGGKDVMQLSEELARLMEEKDYTLKPTDLAGIKGIGEAKGCLLMAVMEYARRLTGGAGIKITSPETVQRILFNYADRSQEFFFSLTLNGAHELMGKHIISSGNLNRVYVQPKDVFVQAIKENSAALVVAHNHPSGSLEPSIEDRNMTKRLLEVSELLNIPLLDHIVFSKNGYYSFLEEGLLK
ncbi:MAG: DNA repair protein RadC [Spirochaetales bacterium]|nr:DNA repair protein RadC [Spirochaetales bacterium]